MRQCRTVLPRCNSAVAIVGAVAIPSRVRCRGRLPMLVIGGVLNDADGAIRLYKRVHPVNPVAVAALELGLVVAGVRIRDRVREMVLWWGLWMRLGAV